VIWNPYGPNSSFGTPLILASTNSSFYVLKMLISNLVIIIKKKEAILDGWMFA
jgi:hypothetical protein